MYSYFFLFFLIFPSFFFLSLIFSYFPPFFQFADEAEKEFAIRDKDMKYEEKIFKKLTPLSPAPAARDPKNLIDPF